MPIEAADIAKSERKAARRRMLKAGIIAFNARHSTIECQVRDYSDSGARLIVKGSVGAPDTFDLIIELDGLEASCAVAWRRGDEIGVRFLAPPSTVARKRIQVIAATAADGAKPSLRRKPLMLRE